jgi:hypothetical protein
VADTPVPRGGIVSLHERAARMCANRGGAGEESTGRVVSKHATDDQSTLSLEAAVSVSPSIASGQTPASLSPTPSARLPSSAPVLKMI